MENTRNLEAYAEIVKITGEQADTFMNGVFQWTFMVKEQGYCIELNTNGEKPEITIVDAFDNFAKVYQIIGYAHYYDFKINCNF